MPEATIKIDPTAEFTVYRGLPSDGFHHLLTDALVTTTWRMRRCDGESDARLLAMDDEQAYMEVGIVRYGDVEDPNWHEWLVTISDERKVEVVELVAVEG